MKTASKTLKLKEVMGPIRMLKRFSATAVVVFSVADAHAAWFCPTCHVKHEEKICPNANTTDKFDIWQPTWWCDACQAVHFPKQWWWKDNEQLLVTCKNGCWPCRTCHAVHTAEDAFTQDAWCCPTCRTQHTDGRLYCEQQHGNNTKKVWFCPSCNKPHGTYQPCESAWFCDECKKGYLIGETCPNDRWYCSACQKAYAANESCEHSLNCPQEGGCGKTHRLNEICPKGNMYCLSCKDVLLKGNSCDHYWTCPACNKHHAMNETCPNNYWYCTECKEAKEAGEECEHAWYCSVCQGSYNIGEPCACGKIYCKAEDKRLGVGENCPHYWYCTTENKHHAENVVCTATNPNRWYCPNEACRKAYNVGKACAHSWYCGGCQTRHALTETCMNGWIYCANEGCEKVLNATESCEHYWACPACEKTHHAAADTCPNGYWFCIDCFKNDPSTGIYAQTDGCSHKWWCADCNNGNGIRYDADTACEHRWGCSEDQTGHTFTEPCSAGNWYCTDCDGGTRYASGMQSFCDHTWYCPDCHYGHKLADGCATRWYCSECEDKNKVHTVENEKYCDHSWYCITCQKGHLFTAPCPNGYWHCKTCHTVYNSAGDDATLSDEHSWYCFVDEQHPGCKFGHLKTEPCTQHYRWCGEEGCQRIYDPSTACMHCWECPTCQITYGPNAMCPTDNTWCCGCPAVQDDTVTYCATCEYWPCHTCHSTQTNAKLCQCSWCCPSDHITLPINTMCTNCIRFGCSECGSISDGELGNCCPHYWVCCNCNPSTFNTKDDAVCPNCNTGWFCPDCNNGNGYVYTNSYYCNSATIIHFWRCDTDHLRVPVSESCSGCNYWFCTYCKSTYYNDTDTQGHQRPDLVNNAPLLHAKKTFLEQSPFMNDIPLLNVFKENNKPFEEVHSSNDVPEEKNLIDTAEERHSDGDQTNQPMLRTMEKLKREKNKLFQSHEEDSKEKPKHSSSSSSSSKDKDVKPHKRFIINMRKKDSDDEDPKEFDPKHPSRKTIRFGEHPKFKYNGCKHTHAKNLNIDVHTAALKKTTPNGLKREGYKPINASKVELKSPKQSNSDKYPLLTQSHIKYSKQEDAKRLSSEKKEKGKVPRASKGEGPKLQYNINPDALLNTVKGKPLAESGLSDIEKAAEANEESRIGNLTLKMKQLSKAQMSSKPKKDGSSVVPSLSKVVKNSERKKADRSDNKESKKQSTFNPSSSSSDSDESETPKGNAKDPKIYTNTPTDNLQKSAFKKRYKEDEGNETPSNSLSILKSPKNKHAAPNASSVKPNLTELPPASDESQQFEFKTIEGPKEPTKEDTPKSNDITPIPNGNTPKEETPKSKDKKQSDSEASKKSDEENKSDDDKYSSNDDKKSSHSKSSKSSSKKSANAHSHDNHSEKHSDSEGLKSDKESDKENKSSEHNESANAEGEGSEEEDEASKEEKELSEDSEK